MAGQFTCHLRCAVLLFPSFCICRGDWIIHMSSVLNSYSGSKTRDSRMLHTNSIVSWLCLCRIEGLGEDRVIGKKATDRAETCEFLEDKLHEVEAELKEFREESCWIFQFRCSWTCSLLLLASLILAILAVSWCCVRSCTRRRSVVVDSDGSQKLWPSPSVVVGWCGELELLLWGRNGS